MKRWLMLGALGAVLPFTMLACGDDDDAGDVADDIRDNAGDAADKAGEAAGDAASAVGDVAPVKVELDERNSSGVSGDAVVTPEGNDRTRVSFNLNIAGDANYQAGIYEGDCGSVSGSPEADLGKVDDGASTGAANIGITKLKDGKYVVAVVDGSTMLACGAI